MRISDALVIGLLRESRKVNEEQLRNLLEQQKTDKRPLQELILKDNLLPDTDLTKLYAAPYRELFAEYRYR